METIIHFTMFLQLSVIFSVVLLSTKRVEAEVVTPMYSAGGDPEVDMVKKGISPIPGLVIYDTCGDVRRTLVILGSLLSSQSTNISSVISYGQPALQSRISQFLQPFGILHININQTAYVSTQGDRSIDISTVSPWRVRDILTIVMELKWNNFALISSQHPSAIASRDLFLKMAAPYSLCISSVFIHDKDKEYDDLPSHVILFVSADDRYDEIISSTSFANSFVLLTSDHWEDLTSNFTDKFLYLEHLNTSTNLGRNTFRAVHDGFSEDITPFTGMYQLMKDVGGEMTSYINRGYITVAEVYGNEISIRNTLTWSRVKSLPHDACPKNQLWQLYNTFPTSNKS
uniref:Receptor ligand binding region domain-containing protein n=1 Tax=Magallana gigas TaxID=29159 RepID=A0A8W8LWT7_MAGGI